jgi:hypothetical protein
MPWGIIDIEVEIHLPGTAVLVDSIGSGDVSHLKHRVVKVPSSLPEPAMHQIKQALKKNRAKIYFSFHSHQTIPMIPW